MGPDTQVCIIKSRELGKIHIQLSEKQQDCLPVLSEHLCPQQYIQEAKDLWLHAQVFISCSGFLLLRELSSDQQVSMARYLFRGFPFIET